MFEQALVFADIQHDEFIFRIRDDDLAFEAGRQQDKLFRMHINVQLILKFSDFLSEQFVFFLLTGESFLQGLILFTHGGNLVGGIAALLVLGKFVLGGVALVAGLAKIFS